MKIVIAGAGKVGESLCVDLSAEKHDVILIEKNAQVLETVMTKNDIHGVQGSVVDNDVLLEAGVAECDFFFAITPSDELNIIAAIMAKQLGADYTVARVRNPVYSKHMNFIKNAFLGIYLLINPEREAASEVVKLLEFPYALNIESFAGGKVNLIEQVVGEDSDLDGMSLRTFRKKFASLIVCAVSRGDEVIIPSGDFVIQAGDHLQVTGLVDDLHDLYKSVDAYQGKIRKILIIGAGNISHYICEKMQNSNLQICVIEVDKQRAKELAYTYPRVQVIHGDGSDYSVLDEQHLNSFDCLVALTGIDEENILISMYAAKSQVPRIITKVNRTQMLSLVNNVGLQTVITPKRIISDRILRLTRALANAKGSNIEALYRLLNNRVEALEFVAKPESRVVGISLNDLPIRPNCLIAFIIRQGKVIFPTGNDHIEAEDHILLISTEKSLNDLDDILQ